MISSIAELISARIGAMPAGERRAAQTLIANYPLIGLKTVAEFSQAPACLRRRSCVLSPGSASRTTRNSSRRCRTNWRQSNPVADAQPLIGGRRRRCRRCWRRRSTTCARHSGTCPSSWPTLSQNSDRRGKTFLIGGRFTDPLARYMAAPRHPAAERLHLAGQESIWRDRLIDMGKRDVLVIFDIRRYQTAWSVLPRRRTSAACRSCCSPTNGCRRLPASPAMSSPGALRAVGLGLSAAFSSLPRTLIGAVTRQLEGRRRQTHPRVGKPALEQ
jgi:hypothetical protein